MPRFSSHLRTQWNPHERARCDFLYFHTAPIDDGRPGIELEALNRVDLRVGFDIREAVEFSVAVSNLLDDVHVESFQSGTRATTGIRRGLVFRVVSDF